MARSGGRPTPAAFKRTMPNRCLEIPRNEITSRFSLDNGLLIDVAANATRRGTLYQRRTLDATRGRPQHWLVIRRTRPVCNLLPECQLVHQFRPGVWNP